MYVNPRMVLSNQIKLRDLDEMSRYIVSDLQI